MKTMKYKRRVLITRVQKVGLFMLLLLILSACQKNPLHWPDNIHSVLLVPQDAKNVTYYTLYGSFQVSYRVDHPFPAADFLKSIIEHMERKGWKRLEYDFLDPDIRAYHTRTRYAEEWGHYENASRGRDVYQWIEDFEDSEKNVTRYGLRYERKHSMKRVLEGINDLKVVVIYIPISARPDPASVKKELERLNDKIKK